MKTATEIVELSESANSDMTTIIIPHDWTKDDAEVIGQAVVLGNRQIGYVGAIQRAANPSLVWFSAEPTESFDQARDEAQNEAIRLKRKPR